MVLKTFSSPFGGATRTRLLLLLRLLDASYARELARLLNASVFGVRKALLSLERDALIAGRSVGRTRLFSLNPGYFARRELAAYLDALAAADADLRRRAAALRRRPRRTGKAL